MVCFVGWTIFAGVALWWLLRTHALEAGAAGWVVNVDDSHRQTFADRVTDWLRLAHLNFHRVYPWVLLGPYVALLALYFSLERRRLWLSVAIHVAACAAFVAASQMINARTSTPATRIVIINARSERSSPRRETNSDTTNAVERITAEQKSQSLEIKQWAFHDDLGQDRVYGFSKSTGNGSEGVVTGEHPKGWTPESGLSNLVAPNFTFKPPVAATGLATVKPLSMLLDLLAYGAVLGLSHSVHFYRRYREREHRALVLESNLANARLQALRAQLQPHFLFNSLNAVATLLRRDVRLAEATLMSLSELLRLALTQSEKQEVSLREELAFVQRYLEIQQTRFGEKLRVEQDIDPAALDCLVPTLVLQPLIENAIRHGIEPSESAGLVRLSATKTDGKLVLAVEDDGVGLSPLPLDTRHSTPLTPRGTGIGLTNLRARLVALYGTEQKLELVTRPEGGVRVLIEIPWRLAVTLETAPANNN